MTVSFVPASFILLSHDYFPSLRVPNAHVDLTGHVLQKVVQGYRDEYILDREQLDTVEDMILLRTILCYIIMVPAVEHWQTAMGNPEPHTSECLAWIEGLWLEKKVRLKQ